MKVLTTREKRKHIKPFLNFAIAYYQNLLTQDLYNADKYGLCEVAHLYAENNYNWYSCSKDTPVAKYLKKRLDVARPKNSGDSDLWWGYFTKETIQKRINFCEHQLRIVKV